MPGRQQAPFRVRVRGRVVHSCPGCGASRGVAFAREVRVHSDSRTTEADLIEAVLATGAAEPPASPCPRCGVRLTAAVGRTRHWWDQWAAILIPFLLGGVLFFCLLASRVWVYWLLAVLAPAAVAAELVWVCLVGRRVPSLAGRPGPDGEPAPADPAPARGWAYAALGAAVLALLVNPADRASAGRPLNDRCAPMVVSPGTQVRFAFDNDLSAIKGEWGGIGKAVVLDAAGVPTLPELATKAPPPPDEDLIRVLKDKAGETPHILIAVTLPDDPALVGTTLRLRLDMAVKYPKWAGPKHFEYRTAHLTEERDVVLVPEAERTADQMTAVSGALAGWILTALGSALVLWSDRRLRLSGPCPQVEVEPVDDDSA